MNRLTKLNPILVASVVTVFPLVGQSATEYDYAPATKTTATPIDVTTEVSDAPVEVKDVKTLNKNLKNYSGRHVSVTGKVNNKLDEGALMLESGGVVGNDLVVLAGPKLSSEDLLQLKSNAKIKVVGVLKTASLKDVKNEMGITVQPGTEQKIIRAKAYLIADEISSVE